MGRLPSDSDRVIILTNPKSGARSGVTKVDALVGTLQQRDLKVDVFTDPERMSDEVARAYGDGTLRTVVAAGGDGTVGLVANRTEPGVPVTVLPLGTENLLAKYVKLSSGIDAVGQAICDGRTTALDVGTDGSRLFLLMFSCGFDADVVHRLHARRGGHIHHISYARPILQSILRYQYPELRVYCHTDVTDQHPLEREQVCHWAFVFNLPTYAAGLRIVPDADGSDGRLDVCTFRGGSLCHGLWHLGTVLLGRHRQWDNAKTVRTTKIRIESEGRVPYQLDGDPGGFLPVHLEVLPKRLTLVVPEFLH